MINITDLTYRRDNSVVLDSINMTVEKNTVCGVIGDDRKGLCALADICAGAVIATQGQVSVCGFDIQKNRLSAAARIGYMPEGMSYYENMSVIDYLSFVAEAKDLPFTEAQQSIKSALAATDLYDARNLRIAQLNNIGKIRVGLCQAILSNPEVLILGCSTKNLADDKAGDVFKLIKRLSRSRAVLITSDDDRVRDICSSIVRLSEGKILSDTEEISESEED